MVREPFARWCGRVRSQGLTLPDKPTLAQASALKEISYAKHLLTIPEISTVTLATVLGETGDLSQFRSAAALIKFAGLNLYSMSSGTFCGRTRISKRGRPLVRMILFLAALRLTFRLRYR